MVIKESVSSYITINGKEKLLLPGPLLSQFHNKGRDTSLFEGKANSFTTFRGKRPGVGHVLMLKKDFTEILSTTAFTNYLDFYWGDDTVKIQKLGVIRAEAITGVDEVTDETIYFVTLGDIKHLAMHSAINKAYNIRTQHFLSDDQVAGIDWYAGTTNPGLPLTPYSWQQVINDIWDNLDGPSEIGSLDLSEASLPTGHAEGFDFQGWNAWDALHEVLDAISHSVVLDVDGSFKIVVDGAADSTHSGLITTYKERLISASNNQDTVFVPEKIRVFFPNNDWAFQASTDPTAVHARRYWTTNQFYTVDVSVDSSYNPVSGTVEPFHSPRKAIYDDLGVIQNGTDLLNDANKIAADYIAAMDRPNLHNFYHGAIAFKPGSLVTEVSWYDLGSGLETEVMSSDLSPRESEGNTAIKVKGHHGSSDLTRLHAHGEYLIIADLTEDLQALGSAVARVQYGDHSFPANTIAWSDTSLPHEVRIYEAHGISYSSGDRVTCHLQQQVGKWVVLPYAGAQASTPNELFKVKAKSCTEPGNPNNNTFDIWEWNGSAWADGGTDAIVYDEHFQGMFLPGEFGWAVKQTLRYDLVGTYGLTRRALANSKIPCFTEGDVTILYHDGSANDDCFGLESTCTVTACNGSGASFGGDSIIGALALGFPRTIGSFTLPEVVHIQFYERKWHILPTPSSRLAYGVLDEDLCPSNTSIVGDQAVQVRDVVPLVHCAPSTEGITPGELAVNTFNLSGTKGDFVLLGWNDYLDLFGDDAHPGGSWEIIQVLHYQRDYLEKMIEPNQPPSLAPFADQSDWANNYDPGAVMQDNDLADEQVETPSTGCNYKFKRITTSLQVAGSSCSSVQYDQIDFFPYAVLKDLRIQGTALEGLVQIMWSPEPCHFEAAWMVLFPGSTCPP